MVPFPSDHLKPDRLPSHEAQPGIRFCDLGPLPIQARAGNGRSTRQGASLRVNTLIRVVIGILLIAHGLVHLLYSTDDVPEFSPERSWVIPPSVSRPVAMVLMWSTAAAFALLGFAVWGVPGLAGTWPGIAVAASILSLALLAAFWSWSLIFGVIIDVALIAVAVIRPEWTDGIGR